MQNRNVQEGKSYFPECCNDNLTSSFPEDYENAGGCKLQLFSCRSPAISREIMDSLFCDLSEYRLDDQSQLQKDPFNKQQLCAANRAQWTRF